MKTSLYGAWSLLASTMLFAAAATAQQSGEGPPPWAWGFTTPPAEAPAATPAKAGPVVPTASYDTVKQVSVSGSPLSFTEAQIYDYYGPADWFPGDHPTMPNIVAHGRKADGVFACAVCHLPDGRGHPENANITGFTAAYLAQQLSDFKNGLRETSDRRKTNTGLMAHFAKQLTDDEIQQIVNYYSSIRALPTVKVIEADVVPKTKPRRGVFLKIEGEGAGTEPLGDRILETPENVVEFEMRNPRATIIAYVPPGSIDKGEYFVRSGGDGKTTICTVCHGESLRGSDHAPRLAGLSPSYLFRQLYDFKHGNRRGPWGKLMVPVVSGLNNEEMQAIVAYLASLDP